jgi:hypothetical protein
MKYWIAMGAMLHLAAAQAEPLVQVAGVQDRAAEPPALHVLAGQATGLRLQISSTAPGRGSFQASLFQLASGIAAPLAKELPVAEGVALDATSLQTRTFTVTPPEVKESTTMELRFAWKPENADKWQPAGSVRFLVHPADLYERVKKQLATATTEASVRLIVVGESPLLKPVLRELELTFDEAGSVAETEGATLYLAEAAAEHARELLEHIPASARLLLFTRDPSLPAGVYWTERAGGFVGKVTLPVLTDFRRVPERQLLFANQFQQAIRTLTKTP